MKLTDFTAMLETIAPTSLALGFDNVGLLIGTEREIRRVLVALDCSVAVAEEAIAMDADLVLTHHPLFLHGVKRILPDDPETAAAYKLIRAGIGLYAAHTNLDACDGGVNDALCEALGVRDAEPLFADGIGRVGTLEAPTTLGTFADRCSEALGTTVRFSGDPGKTVLRVGLVGGAGGGDAAEAKALGCDVFVTGEVKHHQAIAAAALQMPLIEGGHYETEVVVLKKWISRLQNEGNDVQYSLTRMETAPWQTR